MSDNIKAKEVTLSYNKTSLVITKITEILSDRNSEE
jgi:hypothetical protein